MKVISGFCCLLFSVLSVYYGLNLVFRADAEHNRPFVIFGYAIIISSIFTCILAVFCFVSAGVIVFL